MGYTRYRYEDLERLCSDVFQKFGYSLDDSQTITDVLLTSDLFGIESHGIQRLILYYSGIKIGRIKVNARMKIINETPLSAVVDAQDSMGQIVAKECMKIAIEKAKKLGVGIVIVRNSNHYGIAGYYARMAAMEGLIGISMTNTEALVIPTYGKRAMLGTNPIAISMPAQPIPFLLDMSTSVVTRGKTEIYKKNAKPLPLGWAVDRNGLGCDDAKELSDCICNKICGGLLPLGGSTEKFGGHKGFGLSLAVELFTSILSCGYTSDQVRKVSNIDRVCHAFFAIDYKMFGDKKEIEDKLSEYLQKLRDSDKADGASRIFTHGEKEMEAYNDRKEKGIPMNDATMKEIKDICDYFGLSTSDYLKDII